MLFLHMLLFFLLHTSVVALLHDYKNPEHHDIVRRRRPLLFDGLLQLLPTELRWFIRIPKEPEGMNDVFQLHHDGSITFRQLNAKPGTGYNTIDPVVLTALNSGRILGAWRPMPSSDVPIDIRFNQVTFYKSETQIKYHYHKFRPTAMLKLSSGTDGELAKPFPSDASGIWNRRPSKDAHEEDCNDVIILDDDSNPKLNTLTGLPGGMRLISESVSKERLVGEWLRMPGASVPYNQRNDLLKITKTSDGLFHYYKGMVLAAELPPHVAAAG